MTKPMPITCLSLFAFCGLTVPLATPLYHTGANGLQTKLNQFLQKKLVPLPNGNSGTKSAAKAVFQQKTFAEQKQLIKELYESEHLKMPDFNSPSLL